MSYRTNSQETQTINGGITVTALNGEPGIIEVDGSIYADNFESNTINSHLTINGIKIKDSTFTLSSIIEPDNPVTGNTIFYLDSSDNQFKFKTNTGSIYNLTPLSDKGQLITHNGSTNSILPKGNDGYVLSVNDSTTTGLEWVPNNGSSNNITATINHYLVYIDNNPFKITQKSTGSIVLCIEPLIDLGCSGVFLLSKNTSISNNYNKTFLNISRSLTSNGTFDFIWNNKEGFDITKDYSEAIGSYLIYSNTLLSESELTLSSTTQVSLDSPFNNLSGCYFFSIFSYNESFPGGNYIITKSISSNNAFSLAELNTSKGTGNTKLIISWDSSLGIKLSKSSNNCDGIYKIVNNFSIPIKEVSIILFNTSSTVIEDFNYYKDKAFFMEIVSNVTNGPCAIFSITKNNINTYANVIRYGSPGIDNTTQLNVIWASNSKLNVSKTTNNYNGTYLIKFYFI